MFSLLLKLTAWLLETIEEGGKILAIHVESFYWEAV